MDNIPVKKLQTQKMVSLSKKEKEKKSFPPKLSIILCVYRVYSK